MDTDNIHSCSFCDYTTTRKYNLKRHEISMHSKEILNENKPNDIPEEVHNVPENVINTNEVTNIHNNKPKYFCSKCSKEYSTIKYLNNHEEKCIGINILTCPRCMKTFSNRHNKSAHIKNNKCKAKSIIETHHTIEIQTDDNFDTTVNNKLINLIIQKDKKLEILNKKIDENEEEITIPLSSKCNSISLNNVIITSRTCDNYINATLLCRAGNKILNNWLSLKSTKKLIEELIKDEENITVIDEKSDNEFVWIHPDLAIQLSQWISPNFVLQVSKWIRNLFNNKNIDKIIKEKDQRIKLLENTFLKKHSRVDYKVKNVIYMLSTKDYIDKRIYIIGKTENLANRLSQYNKTIDHYVIYYKECKNEEYMNFIEKAILNKLDEYREIANRDRFILPLENDITLFTNIIDNIINVF